MKVLKENKGERGVATILVVGVLVVFLIFFLVVAIDFAYIYVVRGQVQNAADAAAIAGTDVLSDPNDTVQFTARAEAIKFAAKNSAAGESVVIVTDNTNVLSGNNDITVGFWNGTGYQRGGTPVNAMEVRPRRTQGSPGGPVGLFFGRLVDWPEMEVSRIAVAVQNPLQIIPLPVCLPTCDLETPLDARWGYDKNEPDPILCTDEPISGTEPPGQQMFIAPSSQDDVVPQPGLAWTNFAIRDCPAQNCDMPNKDEVLPYITGELRPINLCGKHICTTNGTITPLAKNLAERFEAKKRLHQVGSESIEGWKVLVPVVSNLSCGQPKSSCPGAMEGESNPYLVKGFAEVLVTEVVTTGTKGIRVIGLENPIEKSFSVTCKDGPVTFTRTVSAVASTNDLCSDCTQPLPTEGSFTSRLVR